MKKYFQNYGKRNTIFALSVLALVAVIIIASGGWAVAGGLALAIAPVALTDEETAFLAEVKGAISREVEKFEKGYVSKDAMEKFIVDKLDEVKNTLTSKEDYEALKQTIEDQGLEIKELKEKGEKDPKEGILTKFFVENAKKADLNDRNHTASTTIKAAALMTTANIIPETASGFSPLFGNYIDTEVGAVPKPDPVMLPLVTVTTQLGTEKIYYSDRVNEDGDAAFIAEGSLKPLVDADWQTLSAPIEEVAERWKMTKRLMNHAPSVVADFLEHAREVIELKIDDNLIAGGGVSPALNGIEDLAAAFTAPTALANYYPLNSTNIYDVIMAVATTVRLNNFKGQLTCLLNTVWKAKMAAVKDTTTGQYIIPPFVTPDGMNVGEVKLVFTNQVSDSQLTLGDLKKFRVVFAENVDYDEGYENDDFSKNLVSKKLEAFLGTYMKASDAGSIISDDIATITAAIEADA